MPGEPDSRTASPAPSAASGDAERFFVPWLVGLVVVATLVKLVLIATTEGTSDTRLWTGFALYALDTRSLFAGYEKFSPVFNHPPLGTLLMAGSVGLGKLLGTPFGVHFWVRVPGLLADLAGAAAIERLLRSRLALRERRLVVAGLLLSPLPAAVGIYHGNTDLVWVAVLLWAAWALEDGRAALAGALVGAAVGIKLPAVVVLAPLGVAALRTGRGAPFSLGFLAAAAPVYLAGLRWGGSFFVSSVIFYKGTRTAVPWPPGSLLVPVLGESALEWFRLHGSLVVLAAVVGGVALSGRRTRPAEALAVALGLTLLVVPTFGAQYLAWFAAPVVVLGWRWAVAFHTSAAVQAFLFYSTAAPLFLQDPEHAAIWSPWPGRVTWLVLAGCLDAALRAGRATKAPAQVAPGAAGGDAPGAGGASSRA